MSGRRSLTVWLTVVVVAATVLIGGGFWVVSYFKGALAPGLSIGCSATAKGGAFNLAVDQTENAALISAISVQRGMPARAASIALATALQESKLRNINYGDLDSLGLFQQRPSQEWGTKAEIMDPVYSTNEFYNVLEKVPGYQDMPLNDAAQIVQRSGFPQAYAQHEDLARAFASALTGQTAAGLNCTLPPATPVSTPADLETALHAVLGPLGVASTSGQPAATVRLQVADATGWTAAQWALANAHQFGITRISYDGKLWDRTANQGQLNVGWTADPAPDGTGMVTLLMASGS
ncbi:MAG: hypothetical protein WBX27_00935 [Specibacter sp.]